MAKNLHSKSDTAFDTIDTVVQGLQTAKLVASGLNIPIIGIIADCASGIFEVAKVSSVYTSNSDT